MDTEGHGSTLPLHRHWMSYDTVAQRWIHSQVVLFFDPSVLRSSRRPRQPRLRSRLSPDLVTGTLPSSPARNTTLQSYRSGRVYILKSKRGLSHLDNWSRRGPQWSLPSLPSLHSAVQSSHIKSEPCLHIPQHLPLPSSSPSAPASPSPSPPPSPANVFVTAAAPPLRQPHEPAAPIPPRVCPLANLSSVRNLKTKGM